MNSKITWSDIDQRLEFAKLYHKFGMMIARVCGREDAPKSFKEPEETWDKQTLELVESRDWENSTGIDLILGVNDYRCIDIDEVDGPPHYGMEEEFLLDHAQAVRQNFIFECLKQLGLPSTYEWIIKSPHGYHIIIRAKNIEGMPVSIAYSPNKSFTKDSGELMSFSRIELLWRTQSVMPPSAASITKNNDSDDKVSYKCYEFINCLLPHSAPVYVDHSQIDRFLNYFCGESSFISAVDYGYVVDYLAGAKFYHCLAKEKIDEGSWVDLEELYASQFGDSSNQVEIPFFKGLDSNIKWLKACGTPEALNKLGIISQIVHRDSDKAFHYFTESDTEQAHYNIACLMARNYIPGSLDEMETHLLKSSLPEQYKSQLRLYYSLRHDEDPRFVFLSLCTTAKLDEAQSIDDVNSNPDLIQVSWIETDSLGNSLSNNNFYVPADGFEIPLHVSRSGGLTTEQAKRFGNYGWDLSLLRLLEKIVSKCKIVTFDATFCKTILRSTTEKWHIDRWCPTPEVPEGWENEEFICLKTTASKCIEAFSSVGASPSFGNLYKSVCGEEYVDRKDSLYRAEGLKRLFFKMKEEQYQFITISQ